MDHLLFDRQELLAALECNLDKAQAAMKYQTDLKRRQVHFAKGDMVLINILKTKLVIESKKLPAHGLRAEPMIEPD